jgi:ferredoxin-NADP reductase
MKLILVAKRHETEDVMSFMFSSDTPLKWQAGQFLRYSLLHPDADDRGIARYFTIASAPVEGHIMLTTRFASQRSSSFKRALRQLPVGAAVEVSEPDGNFVGGDPRDEHVFIAGGIGVTPFRAILLDLDHSQLPIKATLLYANRTSDFVYKAEMDRLAAQHPGLVIRYLVSPKRVTESSILAAAPELGKPTFHVSGPAPFVEAVGNMLWWLGVPDAHVKRDYFIGYHWPSIDKQGKNMIDIIPTNREEATEVTDSGHRAL